MLVGPAVLRHDGGVAGRWPVLVHIYGGGLAGGSNVLTLYSDAFPREQDVALVGINHRLNVFGYLYLGELSGRYAVGNVGKLGLVAALEWVRDNIAAFGGAPEKVSIPGESGGGARAAFARSGDPSHSELPRWPAYDPAQRATTVFSIPSQVLNDPDGEERRLLCERPSRDLL
jgi:carboxylesterase type B